MDRCVGIGLCWLGDFTAKNDGLEELAHPEEQRRALSDDTASKPAEHFERQRDGKQPRCNMGSGLLVDAGASNQIDENFDKGEEILRSGRGRGIATRADTHRVLR